METKIKLCPAADVAEGEALRVEVEGHAAFAVYRSDGEYYVSDDLCTHGEASLAEGFVEQGQVECPWHSGRFCLKTGAALSFPAVLPIRVYPVTVEDGMVCVRP